MLLRRMPLLHIDPTHPVARLSYIDSVDDCVIETSPFRHAGRLAGVGLRGMERPPPAEHASCRAAAFCAHVGRVDAVHVWLARASAATTPRRVITTRHKRELFEAAPRLTAAEPHGNLAGWFALR
jgi:hypothetical protein